MATVKQIALNLERATIKIGKLKSELADLQAKKKQLTLDLKEAKAAAPPKKAVKKVSAKKTATKKAPARKKPAKKK